MTTARPRASTERASSLDAVLAAREVLVFCGSGGVGKTSTAAAAALGAAVHVGGRVLVLTIDPAKRLADALGLEGIGNVERRVPDDVLRACGLHPRGELWAAMLDTKASWDDLVLRHAPDETTRYDPRSWYEWMVALLAGAEHVPLGESARYQDGLLYVLVDAPDGSPTREWALRLGRRVLERFAAGLAG